MIDKEVVIRQLLELEETVDQLSRLGSFSLEELEKEKAKQWQVERGLQIAIQNVLDVGSHLLAALGKNRCETYTDIIDALAAERIIPQDFAGKIRGMAGFRNILVHDYLDVDISKVHRILQNQLGDFRSFIKYISGYLEGDV